MSRGKTGLSRREALASAAALTAAAALPTAASATSARASAEQLVIDVRSLGAAGDGTTRDTLAIQQALDRCALLGGGEVRVPAGTYLIGTIAVGPGTTLRLDEGATLLGSPDLADYPIRQVRWEGRFVRGRAGLVTAENADRIAILGRGRIVGSPAIRGRIDPGSGLRNPTLVELVNCRGVEMRGLRTEQNGMWSIHPLFCTDLLFADLQVIGGADGIDLDSCQRARIERCTFETADDCISLKSGRGEEGRTLARPTSDVRISDCIFRDSVWACIGIGSETSGGISGVRVERCRFLGAKTHAVYIKSRPGRGAYIRDIAMRDLEVGGTGLGFLRLNFLSSGKQDEFPVPGLDGIPSVGGFSFADVRVADAPVLVEAWEIHPAKPLEGFSLADISGTCRAGLRLANIRNARLSRLGVSGFAGPLLRTWQVSGSGLAGAAPLPPPKLPDAVPEPAIPYRLS